MTRVFFVIDTLEVGGAQRQLLYLVRNLAPTQYATACCSLWPIMDLEQEYLEADTKMVYVHKHSRYDISTIWRLARIMREFRPQIVHTWMGTANRWGYLSARLAGVPVVIASRRNLIPERFPRGFIYIDRLFAKGIDTIIANSYSICRQTQQLGIRAQNGCCVVNNGIDLKPYQNPPTREVLDGCRSQIGLRTDRPILGTVGRLVPQKDQRTFLFALRRIHDAGILVQAVIVGQGKLRLELESLCVELGLSESVFFTGIRKDIPNLMYLFDVFALSSLWEGLPNVVLEAMAASRPVVATDVGGVAEAVEAEVTGLVVPPNDPDSLAESLLELLRDPAKSLDMGMAGRKRVEDEFSIGKMVSKTTGIYEEMLSL